MPGHIYTQKSKAQVRLKFIIIGGNIAGLATAYALRTAGHSVLVVEKSDGKARSRGGLRSPPNMTRILNQWGLAPALAKISSKCNTFNLHNGYTGESIGSMIMTESFLLHLLADFLFVQHGDLHSLLYDAARQAGVKFLFRREVTGANSDDVSITLKDGEILRADVIVGADGPDSVVRPIVTGEEEELEELQEKRLWITFTIPADQLREDKELEPLTNPLNWSLWLGDGYILHGNLLAGGKEFTVSIVYNYDLPLREGDDQWQDCTLDRFPLDYSKFEPRTLKLLKLAKSVSSRITWVRPHLESLVCDRARIVIVGDAAHPLLPSGHHTTALALEDAQTLGSLFSRIRYRHQVPQLLAAYEEIRQPRVSATQLYEVQQQAMLSCPGPAMAQRDSMMRNALAYGDWEHMDEATFKMVWGNELTLVSHDAGEQVDDWWTQWGSYFERSERERNTEARSSVQISICRGNGIEVA